MKKSEQKGRYNFLLDNQTYADFSMLCDELGFVRSKKVEQYLKQFLQEHQALLMQLKEKQKKEER